jgi:hypothetical protein
VGRPLRTLLDIGSGSVGELRVPHEVLGAVKLAPVPVSAHHSTNEVEVVLMRGTIVFESAGFDFVRRRSDCGGSCESGECGGEPHLGLEL